MVVKNLPANAEDARDTGLIPGSRRFPWNRKWQPTPVFLPGEFSGQRSLAGYIQSMGLDKTERLSTCTNINLLVMKAKSITV